MKLGQRIARDLGARENQVAAAMIARLFGISRQGRPGDEWLSKTVHRGLGA